MRDNISVSYCIGVYNEEKILSKSINSLNKNLTNILGKNNFEVIIVDNGSTDKTWSILQKNKLKPFRAIHVDEKGHGLALKLATQRAKKTFCVITAIDIPFGFDDLKQFIELHQKYDIIFGSKAHPKSKIDSTIKRKVASTAYRSLLKILFGLDIRDPQGSIFFKRTKVLPLLNKCNAKNAFFTTQIAIRARIRKLKMTEVPVTMKADGRKSRYSLVRDGKKMFQSMLQEYYMLHFAKG